MAGRQGPEPPEGHVYRVPRLQSGVTEDQEKKHRMCVCSDREGASVQLKKSKQGQLPLLAVGKRQGQSGQTANEARRQGWGC